MDAMALLASARWDDALSRLAAARKERGSPSAADYYLPAFAHDRAGRSDSAIVWYERTTTRQESAAMISLLWPASHRRLGELYEAKADTAKAIEHYEWFADRWKNADPSLQSTVRSVRARAAALKARYRPG